MNLKDLIIRCIIIILSLVLIFRVEFVTPYVVVLVSLIIGSILDCLRYKQLLFIGNFLCGYVNTLI